MKRANVVRAALAIVVLVVSGWLVAARPARLGLDLRGGTQIVLQTKDGERTKATAKTTDEASALEQTGQRPRLVMGSAANLKVTYRDNRGSSLATKIDVQAAAPKAAPR